MKEAFFGSLIVCVLIVLLMTVGVRVRKVRSMETKVAVGVEATYRDLSSMQPNRTLYQATQVVEFLTDCLDPNSQIVFRSSALNSRVEAARCLAVSNLVAWLEGYSGMTYGTNIQQWQDWLQARPPEVKAGSVK